MKKLRALSMVDYIGNPEAAVLVDSSGFPVDETTDEPAEHWNILAFTPPEPFMRFLLEGEACLGTSDAIGMPQGGTGGLVFVLQLGQWQHRVLLPLLGPFVERYLKARPEAAPVFRVQLTATGIPEARSFNLEVQADAYAFARRVVRPQFDADHGMHRREMAELCLTASSGRVVPRNADGQRPALVTLARVWPPGLPPIYRPGSSMPKGAKRKG
jgi:hypothetical protein